MTQSWKGEVIADTSGQWVDNALRFATRDEAEAYINDLFMRWTLVREKRVVESDDPVSYVWKFDSYKAVPLGGTI